MIALRTNDFSHVLPGLVKHIQESGVTPHLVRVDGVMGVGKSSLADMLADALDASPNVIHVDEFAYGDKIEPSLRRSDRRQRR